MKYHFIRTSAPSLRTRTKTGETILKRDDKGLPIEVCNVDQFSGRIFMLNASGFMCNDIMSFEQAQSDSVAHSVLQRINVLHPQPTHAADLSTEEIFERIVPANYNSPTDYVRISKKIAELDIKRAAFLKQNADRLAELKKAKESAIQFTKEDKNIVDNV